MKIKYVILIPLVTAFLWMLSLIANANDSYSPLNVEKIVFSLFIFILVYSAVISFVFVHLKEKGIEGKIK